ncbi:uncharacterized protein [Asterias amurensis]|uniref:uncharacterized protein n=1 Tax=Asterias amurensis TaxID=7602 RepID=UPI003AB4EF03
MEGFLDTKLHEAVRYGDTNLVESALKDGLDPNAIGLYQWSALHEACSNGDLEIVRLLLQFKGDPNAKDDLHGCTAVHYAGREGHVDCLEALLENGGRHNVANNDGETGLDVAVGKCKEILDKKRAEELITTSVKRKPRHYDNEVKVFRDDNPEKAGKDNILSEREGATSPTPSFKSDTPTAWDAIQVQETNAEPIKDAGTGHLQLSFEYNSRTSIMKIRVWQLEDLLLPPAEVANVTRLSIKSRLLPDKKGDSKRKTEDARLEDPAKMKTSLVSVKRKSAKESFKAIYLPCTFLFTKPLEYKNITKEIVESKTVHIDVNVKHKYTNKSFTVANLQLPLKEAVRKLRKRKYRLHPCINYSMPDNVHSYDPSDLVIVSEGMYTNKTVSNPNLRSSSEQSLKVAGEQRATSDINLQTVRCHSTESIPSVSLSIPDDEQMDHDALQAITVMNDSPRSTHLSHSNPDIHVVEIQEMNTLLPGTIDSGLSEVKVESLSLSRFSRSTPNIPVLQIEDLEGETPVKKLTRPTSPPNRLAVPPASYHRPRKQSSSSRPKQEPSDAVNLRRSTKSHDRTTEPPKPGRAIPISAVHKSLGSSDSYDVAKEMVSHSNPAGVFHISEKEALGRKEAIVSKIKDKKKEHKGHQKLLRTFSEKEGIFSPVFQDDEDHSSNAKYSEISELSTATTKLSASKFNKVLGQKSEAIDGKTSKTSKRRDKHSSAALPMSQLTLSPNNLPEVQTVSETQFGNWKPGKHSTPKKSSPRDKPSLERVDASSRSVASNTRGRVPDQGFPQPLTHGLMHTDLNRPTSPTSLSPERPTSPRSLTPDRFGSPRDLNTSSRSSSPGSEAMVHFLSETENHDRRPRQTTPDRRIKSPTRETQPRPHRNHDPMEFEMSPLRLDPTFKTEMATPEFKLKMFQRTSKDPHPAIPHVIQSARKKQLLNSQQEVSDPFFIPESPSGSPMVNESHSNQHKVQAGNIYLPSDGKTEMKQGELRAVENQSVVRVKQSWL